MLIRSFSKRLPSKIPKILSVHFFGSAESGIWYNKTIEANKCFEIKKQYRRISHGTIY